MKVTRDFLRSVKKVSRIVLGHDLYMHIQVQVPTERHGTAYGGWVICPRAITKQSIVYSFGVGEDISFDTSLISKYEINVHAFDPTPKSISWIKSQTLLEQFKFYEYGIADYDGEASFYPPKNPNHVSYTIVNRYTVEENAVVVPVRKLTSIMADLGHHHIDILKMDIEGAEYSVIEDIVKSKIRVSQILVEFHHRFENIKVKQTKYAIDLLGKHGYKIFSISPSGEEFSFIHV